MKKVIKCHACGNYMVYTEDKENEELGWFNFECDCGESCLTPKNNPNIQEVEDDEIKPITKEQLYNINDVTFDYDGCNTVEGFKKLVDEIRERVGFCLKEEK